MSVSETCHEVLLASHGEVALALVFADHAGTSCANRRFDETPQIALLIKSACPHGREPLAS